MSWSARSRSADSSKESVNAKKMDVKYTASSTPEKKNIVLAKKSFSPSKPTSPHINVYVCGLTHGVMVMRTEKSNKKNVEGYVQPLKNKCMEDINFASSLDLVKVSCYIVTIFKLRIYSSLTF